MAPMSDIVLAVETLPQQLTAEELDNLAGTPQPCEWGTFKDMDLYHGGKRVVSSFEDCPETAVEFFGMTNHDPYPHPILVGLCADHSNDLRGVKQ